VGGITKGVVSGVRAPRSARARVGLERVLARPQLEPDVLPSSSVGSLELLFSETPGDLPDLNTSRLLVGSASGESSRLYALKSSSAVTLVLSPNAGAWITQNDGGLVEWTAYSRQPEGESANVRVAGLIADEIEALTVVWGSMTTYQASVANGAFLASFDVPDFQEFELTQFIIEVAGEEREVPA